MRAPTHTSMLPCSGVVSVMIILVVLRGDECLSRATGLLLILLPFGCAVLAVEKQWFGKRASVIALAVAVVNHGASRVGE